MRLPRLDRPRPADFLATLLVRFGEFSSATLDPADGTLRLVIFLPRAIPPTVYRTFRRKVVEALSVLHELERRPAPTVWIRHWRTQGCTRIEVVRTLSDLMYEELNVIAQLSRELLPLEASPQVPWTEEEREGQEERLREGLEHLREARDGCRLVGLREEGHVLVYAARTVGHKGTLR